MHTATRIPVRSLISVQSAATNVRPSCRRALLQILPQNRVLPHKLSLGWAYHSLCQTRSFTNPSPLQKKVSKGQREAAAEESVSESKDNPFDFSELEGGIKNALDRLQSDLSKLRPGGRFNPELVEVLKITLTKGSKETVQLSDLAQVLPRGGRTIVVLVGEANHVKPISTAILASSHSLNPTPSPTNPLELTIPIPPPTQESRQAAVTAVTKAGELAADAVRMARGAQQKKLRAMGLAKTVRPDDLKKAGDRMEKIVEGGNKDVKKVVEDKKKSLERG